MKIKGFILAGVFLLLTCAVGFSDNLPAGEDINSLAQNAKVTRDTFFADSYQMRLRYEYAGKFPAPADCNELKKIAGTARDRLWAIAHSQQQLIQKIEDYQEPDWEEKYGVTGLWRKLSTNILTTRFYKCEVDYCRALTEQWPEKNEILNNLLGEIKSLEKAFSSADLLILKARTYGLLASTNPTYNILAKKHFDSLAERFDIGKDKAFWAEIERINLLGEKQQGHLEKLSREPAFSNRQYDTELILKIALLQRRMRQMQGFERTVTTWPRIQDFVGFLILEDLYNRNSERQLNKKSLQKLSVIEAELAANAAWKDDAKNYVPLLTTLTQSEKFQTALILYVTASKLSQSSPATATELLIKASQSQQQQQSRFLKLAADKIAEQAANYALQLFNQGKIDCYLAIKAFDNYQQITNEKTNDELQYYHVNILEDCNEKDKADKLLENLATTSKGIYGKTARFDLIINKIKQKELTEEEVLKYLGELRELISDFNSRDKKEGELREQAVKIYCSRLLDFGRKETAENVLEFLDTVKQFGFAEAALFKSKALGQCGRFKDAVKYMTEAVDFNDCQLGRDAIELVRNLISQIDEFESESEFLGNCKKLAEYGYNCFEIAENGLMLVEISILTANKRKDELSEIEQLLKTVENLESVNEHILSRCRARLLTKQGRFSEAAELWSQINKTLTVSSASANTRSRQWWRAKYYELYCWSRLPDTKKDDVLHNIEVLENSFTAIPQLWAEKLSLLKQRTRMAKNSS